MASYFTMESMYSFIRDINGGATHREWIKLADANGDGTLTKSEFTKWIEEELPTWTGVEAYQAKGVIENFWYGIDTNRSAENIEGTRLSNLHAVSEEEMVDMEIRLQKMDEYYEILSIIEAPKNLRFENRVRWVTEVREKLGNKMDDLLDKGKKVSEDLEVYEEYKKVVMEVTPSIAIDDMQTDCASIFAKYAYDIRTSEDKEQLLELVESYIQDNLAKIAGNSQGFAYGTVDAVETFVKDFMSEAMLEDELKEKDSSYTYKDATGFVGYSELQRKVLSKDLYDELTSDADWSPVLKNEGASKDSDIIKALKGFTDDILDDTPNAFETIYNDKVNTFKNHDIVQEHGIDYYIDKMQSDTIKTVIDADVETALKSAGLTAEQSAILSDFILNASNASVREDVANDLINDIKTYSRTDAKDSPAIKNALAKELVKYDNVEVMFESGYPTSYGYDDLNLLHDARFAVIKNASANQSAIDSYVDYCNRLIAMGGLYKQAVEAVNAKYSYTIDGNNLKKSSSNVTASDAMTTQIGNTLVPEIRTYTNPANWSKTWSELSTLAKMPINTTREFAAKMSVSCNGTSLTGVTYVATCTNGTVTNLGDGKFSLTSPASEGTGEITITASLNGENLGTKVFTVQYVAFKEMTVDTLVADSGASRENDVYNDCEMNNAQLSSLGLKQWNITTARNHAISRVNTMIDSTFTALAGKTDNAGYELDALRLAVTYTKEYFKAYINVCSSGDEGLYGECDKTAEFSANGEDFKKTYRYGVADNGRNGYLNFTESGYDIKFCNNSGAEGGYVIKVKRESILAKFAEYYERALNEI